MGEAQKTIVDVNDAVASVDKQLAKAQSTLKWMLPSRVVALLAIACLMYLWAPTITIKKQFPDDSYIDVLLSSIYLYFFGPIILTVLCVMSWRSMAKLQWRIDDLQDRSVGLKLLRSLATTEPQEPKEKRPAFEALVELVKQEGSSTPAENKKTDKPSDEPRAKAVEALTEIARLGPLDLRTAEAVLRVGESLATSR